MGKDTFHYTRLLKAPSNLALNTSMEGASTASLGNLFQCLVKGKAVYKLIPKCISVRVCIRIILVAF